MQHKPARSHYSELFGSALALLGMLIPVVAASQADSSDAGRAAVLDTVKTRVRSVTASPLVPASAVDVTNREKVATSPVRILPDALREATGVQVQQTNAGHGTIILRGLTGNQVLLLVDGIRLNNATVRDGPNQYLALIDPERIERLEVIRGPGSTLYGSDAMGGVVNVVTKSPNRQNAMEAALFYASADDGLRAHLGGNVSGSKVRARAGFTGTVTEDLRAGGSIGRQPRTGYSSLAGNATIEADLAGCARASLSGQGISLSNVSRYDRLVNFRYDAASPEVFQGPDAEFLFDPQTQVMGVARVEADACPGWLPGRGIAVGAALQREGRLQRGAQSGMQASPTREYQRDDTRTLFLTAHAEPRLGLGSHLRFGIDVYDDVVSSFGYEEQLSTGQRTPLVRVAGNDSIPAGRFPDGSRMTTIGAYVHGARLLGTRARLLGGLRWDRAHVSLRAGDDFGGDVDATNNSLSAHVGVAAFFAGGISTAIHLGQGFRAPNIYDLSTVSNVPGGIVLPSPDLGPERSTTLEMSVRKAGQRASAGAAVYATRITGFIDRTPGSYRGDTLFNGLRVFRAANIGSAWIRGVEVNGDSRLTRRLSVRGQAFHTYGSQKSVDGGHEPVGRIPPLSGSLALRRVMGSGARGAWVEAGVRASGPQDRLSARDQRDSRIQPGGTPGFAVWMLRASLNLWGATLSGGFENVFDRGYREHGSGIDAPGRQVWLRLDLRNQTR